MRFFSYFDISLAATARETMANNANKMDFFFMCLIFSCVKIHSFFTNLSFIQYRS
jgi:hypothetical protein